jgi:hypothetical protein
LFKGTPRAVPDTMGTQIVIEDALLYPDSTRTLLSYKDICRNGFHVETNSDNKDGYLFITKHDRYNKRLLDKIPSLSSGLYYTYIKPVQHVAYKVIFKILISSRFGMIAFVILA